MKKLVELFMVYKSLFYYWLELRIETVRAANAALTVSILLSATNAVDSHHYECAPIHQSQSVWLRL